MLNVIQFDQTGLGRSGGFGPVSLPLFQGNRYERGGSIHLILHGHTPRLGYRAVKHEPPNYVLKSGGSQGKADFVRCPATNDL